jgi:tryptophan synthase alpha chain
MKTLLVPYVTGGIRADWTDYLLAYQDAGADAIEIGLPFSDPMLDGVTIQRASDLALARGATPDSILADLTAVRDRIRVPLIVMTYANLALRTADFGRRLREAGVRYLIVPDLPVDELTELDIDVILLAAPSTTDERLREICARSRGYVYAVSVMGTTGERDTLAGSAATLAARVKAMTALPVLVGFGITTPEQAAAAGRAGHGAVIASALMRKVIDGATPSQLTADVVAFRSALDQDEALDREAPAGTAYAEVSGDRR